MYVFYLLCTLLQNVIEWKTNCCLFTIDIKDHSEFLFIFFLNVFSIVFRS